MAPHGVGLCLRLEAAAGGEGRCEGRAAPPSPVH
jgi:hypothetical protein